MKKISISVLSVLLSILMLFGLTACGDDSSSNSDSGSSSVESNTQKSKLSEFLESDLIADQLDTVKKQFGSLMDIDVYAADDATLVYGFTYKDEIPESQLDVMKETFEQAFTSMSSTYEQIAATVGKALDIDNMCVRVEFFTNDGTMLFSKDFYAGGGSSESGFSI